jgi:hypothetical protein
VGFTASLIVKTKTNTTPENKKRPGLKPILRKQATDKTAQRSKGWTGVLLVENNAFNASDCHGSNSSILSKIGLVWSC